VFGEIVLESFCSVSASRGTDLDPKHMPCRPVCRKFRDRVNLSLRQSCETVCDTQNGDRNQMHIQSGDVVQAAGAISDNDGNIRSISRSLQQVCYVVAWQVRGVCRMRLFRTDAQPHHRRDRDGRKRNWQDEDVEEL
jgi:hypothetical protein